MKNLAVRKILKNLKASPYYQKPMALHFPKLWNPYHYENATETFYGDIIVNPIDLLVHTIETISSNDYKNEFINNEHWIDESVVYSIHLRTFAAYDSDKDGYITQENTYGLNECGTFLKAILLLPHLKHIGINTLYFLPIFKHSTLHKKGDLGSSYSVTNYFELDSDLYDPMASNVDLLTQAQCFFALANHMGFKTVIDIIPRTCALDADLIKSHPDWFYWIKKEAKSTFSLPVGAFLEKSSSATREHMIEFYEKETGIDAYIAQFSYDPKTIDEALYNYCVKESDGTVASFLELVEEKFNICVAPAFSDCLNDPQAPWSDITYLRLYMDLPELATKYYPSEIPYIFYDSAKASLNPGTIKNQGLWDYISDIIPYWQHQFGIDGLRLDMGHALPAELVSLIKQKALANDPSCVFIAEELNNANHILCKNNGYDIMSGNGFGECYHVHDGRAQAFYYGAKELVLPIFALAESHDSPRLVQRDGDIKLSRMVTNMLLFTPNAIPFINNGQECYELAPLNIGLDATKEHQYPLDKNDPRYGKLGLFDATWMDWKESDLMEDLNHLASLRQLILPSIFDEKANTPLYFAYPGIYAYGSTFAIPKVENTHIVALANANVDRCELFVSLAPLVEATNKHLDSIECIYSTDSKTEIVNTTDSTFTIESDGYTFMLFKITTK